MLSGNCTETLSIQVSVTIPCSRAKLITNGIAPLPFPLPALLKQFRYIKRGERVRVRGHSPFYATLGFIQLQLPNLGSFKPGPEGSVATPRAHAGHTSSVCALQTTNRKERPGNPSSSNGLAKS